jgi:hypothetical protein
MLSIVKLMSMALFGAVSMQYFSGGVETQGGTQFLKVFIVDKPELFYKRVNLVIATILGATIGFLYYSPDTAMEALAAGFGWTGAVKALSGGVDSKSGKT